MRGHAIPEAPEIFEGGVTLSVKEGVLQAVGLAASKAIGDIHHMPRLEPFTLAHHRHKGIFLSFPGHPIVPTNVGPGERFITNIKLRLEYEGMTRGVRSQSELNGNALKRIKVDPIRIDIFKELRKCMVPSCDWSFVSVMVITKWSEIVGRRELEAIEPDASITGILRAVEEHFRGRSRLGKVHTTIRGTQRMPGFAFIGKNGA